MKKHSEFQLGDIATFIRGINFKPDDVVKLDVPNAVACMRTKNVQSVLDLSDVWAVDRKFVKRDEQFLRDGDILVSSANSWNLVGKCCYIDNIPYVSSFGGFVSVIRPTSEKIIPRFLYHWFASDIIQTKVRSFGRQTTNISNLDLTRCLELPLSLPSHDEQRRIAAILDKADAIRRKRQQSLKLTDDLVKSQFIEMLGDPVTNPRGWEEKRLGSLVNVRSSKRVYQREQTINGVPFLRVSDLTNKIINGVDTCGLYIAEKLYENFIKNDLVPQPGDILVTSRGTLGLCYIVNDSDRFYFQDGMISWLDNRKRKINSTYLSFLFQCHGIKKQIDQASPGSTVKYLSLSNLEDFKILTPPVALQNEFAAFVEQADKTKFSMLNQIRKIETLLYALMQKYFY